MIPEREKDYNLTKDEYLATCSLENDRNVVIKLAHKGSSIVVWDRLDYLVEAESNLVTLKPIRKFNGRRKTR